MLGVEALNHRKREERLRSQPQKGGVWISGIRLITEARV